MALLRKVALWTLKERGAASVELCFHMVGAKEMARLNWDFLRHEGSTDVITFDYSEWDDGEKKKSYKGVFAGEAFISVDDAVKQAAEFGVSWQEEVARYVIHAILHLDEFDDLTAVERKKMKKEEDRLVAGADATFGLKNLAVKSSRAR